MILGFYFASYVFFTAIGAVIVGVRRPRRHLLNPGFLFVLIYGSGFFLLPAVALAIDSWRLGGTYSPETHFLATVYSLLFGLITVVIFAMIGGTRIYLQWQATTAWSGSRMKTRQVMLCVIAALLLWIIGAIPRLNMIASMGYSSYAANRIVLLSGSGYESMLMKAGVIAFALVTAHQVLKGRPRPTPLLVLTMCVVLLTGIITASRTSLLLWVPVMLFLWLAIRRRGSLMSSMRLILIMLVLAGVLVLGAALGGTRQAIMAGKPAMLELEGGFRYLQGSFGNQELLLWLMENDPEPVGGGTFAAAFVGWVPRRLWSEKPVGGGPVIKNLIFPGSYDLASGRNLTSYTTGISVEAYLNFRWAGLLIAVPLGILLALFSWGMRFLDNPLFAAVYAVWFIYLQMISFSEFFGWVSHIVSAGLVGAIVYIFSAPWRQGRLQLRGTVPIGRT